MESRAIRAALEPQCREGGVPGAKAACVCPMPPRQPVARTVCCAAASDAVHRRMANRCPRVALAAVFSCSNDTAHCIDTINKCDSDDSCRKDCLTTSFCHNSSQPSQNCTKNASYAKLRNCMNTGFVKCWAHFPDFGTSHKEQRMKCIQERGARPGGGGGEIPTAGARSYVCVHAPRIQNKQTRKKLCDPDAPPPNIQFSGGLHGGLLRWE